MSSSKNNFQQSFFQQLSSHFSTKGEMINAIGDLLNIGRDGVYRRLRGETMLTANELIHLSRKYKINLDPPVQENAPEMRYSGGVSTVTTETEYFTNLLQQVTLWVELPGMNVQYSTPDLTILYLMNSPTLLAYRVYLFSLTVWNFDKWKGTPFRPELADPQVRSLANEIAQQFEKVPSREFWSFRILDNILREIEQGVEMGYLDNAEVVRLLYEEIELLIQHMQEMVKEGKRFLPTNKPTANSPDLQVYQSELTNSSNTALIGSTVRSVVFSTIVRPNYLFSSDERIIEQVQRWFDNLTESATKLNSENRKFCIIYFNILRKKIAESSLKVEVTSGLF